MPIKTGTYGIAQSDILIRSAIQAALQELRANPYLLDYVFASLPKDELTADSYGDKELEQAKNWFLNTEIPVVMDTNVVSAQFPCITISLQSSSEEEKTIGDVNYDVSEDAEIDWEALTKPFSSTAYNPNSGHLTVSTDDLSGLEVFPGMFVVDSVGKTYQILDVIGSSVNSTTLVIAKKLVADFSRIVIKPAFTDKVAYLESVTMKEAAQIGCHVMTEAVHLTYLYCVVLFCLLRYKEDFLEGRGMERLSITTSSSVQSQDLDPEIMWTRYISISAYVRQYWPKIFSKIRGVSTDFRMEEVGDSPTFEQAVSIWAEEED